MAEARFDSVKDAARDFVQRAPFYLVVVISAVVVLYVFALVADIIFGSVLYYTTLSALISTGGLDNLYVAKALAMIFTGVFYLSFPVILRHFLLFRKKKAVVLYCTAYCVWYLILAGLSMANPEYVFNPLEGTPRYNFYKDDKGNIELFQKDILYHPQLGVKLSPVNSEVMVEFAKKNPGKLKIITQDTHGTSGSKPTPTPGVAWKFSCMDSRGVLYSSNRYYMPVMGTNKLEVTNISSDQEMGENLALSVRVQSPYESGALRISENDFVSGYLTSGKTGERYNVKSVSIPTSQRDILSGSAYRDLGPKEVVVVKLSFDYKVTKEKSNVFLVPSQTSIPMDCLDLPVTR